MTLKPLQRPMSNKNNNMEGLLSSLWGALLPMLRVVVWV